MIARDLKAMDSRDAQEMSVNKHSRKEYKLLLKPKHFSRKALSTLRD